MPQSKLHVALIMDGNGRWGTRRGLPRQAGHHAGAAALRRVVEAARRQGVGTLTVYGFSSDNWKRPAEEVGALMRLFRSVLLREARRCRKHDIRMRVIGRRDRFGPELRGAIDAAESLTAHCRAMDLRVALDYSAREAILAAAAEAGSDREAFSARLRGDGSPDVDLLVRTGGEQRLSDFLLWEAAYAELYFTERLWPDFDGQDLAQALQAYAGRERRFGGL